MALHMVQYNLSFIFVNIVYLVIFIALFLNLYMKAVYDILLHSAEMNARSSLQFCSLGCFKPKG